MLFLEASNQGPAALAAVVSTRDIRRTADSIANRSQPPRQLKQLIPVVGDRGRVLTINQLLQQRRQPAAFGDKRPPIAAIRKYRHIPPIPNSSKSSPPNLCASAH